MLVYGDALDILKEDSGIYELLADDDNKDSDDGFKVRKQSIAYTGLEAQSKLLVTLFSLIYKSI